jgi:hypothetical protein
MRLFVLSALAVTTIAPVAFGSGAMHREVLRERASPTLERFVEGWSRVRAASRPASKSVRISPAVSESADNNPPRARERAGPTSSKTAPTLAAAPRS